MSVRIANTQEREAKHGTQCYSHILPSYSLICAKLTNAIDTNLRDMISDIICYKVQFSSDIFSLLLVTSGHQLKTKRVESFLARKLSPLALT